MPLKGRLGVESASILHEKPHGFIWLERGKLSVDDGNLIFTTAGSPRFEAGSYDIPFLKISCILMGPGGTVSHDALRLLSRHGTALLQPVLMALDFTLNVFPTVRIGRADPRIIPRRHTLPRTHPGYRNPRRVSG